MALVSGPMTATVSWSSLEETLSPQTLHFQQDTSLSLQIHYIMNGEYLMSFFIGSNYLYYSTPAFSLDIANILPASNLKIADILQWYNMILQFLLFQFLNINLSIY